MKYKLTIETDDPADIIAMLGGSTPDIRDVTPAAPTEDETTNDNPPELDARGIPWDERIHASTKGINKDGTWRYKRGVQESLINKIEAEHQHPTPTTLIPETLRNGPQAAAEPVTYEQVVAKMTEALESGAMQPGDMSAFYDRVGVSNAMELVGNQPALDAAWAALHE